MRCRSCRSSRCSRSCLRKYCCSSLCRPDTRASTGRGSRPRPRRPNKDWRTRRNDRGPTVYPHTLPNTGSNRRRNWDCSCQRNRPRPRRRSSRSCRSSPDLRSDPYTGRCMRSDRRHNYPNTRLGRTPLRPCMPDCSRRSVRDPRPCPRTFRHTGSGCSNTPPRNCRPHRSAPSGRSHRTLRSCLGPRRYWCTRRRSSLSPRRSSCCRRRCLRGRRRLPMNCTPPLPRRREPKPAPGDVARNHCATATWAGGCCCPAAGFPRRTRPKR